MREITELEASEARVMGSLLEKEQTTPDYYPLTLKALVAACNQKSNREPVMALAEHEVLNILRVLNQEVLVERETGARVDRWRHRLDKSLDYNAAYKALITLLILRGAQTLGELRNRSERMHCFNSLFEVEQHLRQLADRQPPLVQELARQPGQKESRWVLSGQAPEVAVGSESPQPAPAESRSALSRSGLFQLEERLRALETRVQWLERELNGQSPDERDVDDREAD